MHVQDQDRARVRCSKRRAGHARSGSLPPPPHHHHHTPIPDLGRPGSEGGDAGYGAATALGRPAVTYLENRQGGGGQPQEGAQYYLKGAWSKERHRCRR